MIEMPKKRENKTEKKRFCYLIKVNLTRER